MNRLTGFLVLAALTICLVAAAAAWAGAGAESNNPTEIVPVFSDNAIHFQPDSASRFDTDHVTAADNGRVIVRSMQLRARSVPSRIIAHVVIRPIPKDEVTVHDKWDRAGNLRLAQAGKPDLEIVKFVTAYGGETEYRVDISHLAPLLKGDVVFKAFIDTWVSPAWRIDFELEYTADTLRQTSDWVVPVLYQESFNAETYADSGAAIAVTIPDGAGRVYLRYYVSGHCTDGRDADEFVSKDNVISVDGVVVYRYQPWRDDCRRYRQINPYTRRWSDGWWSSDYSRSGWCPGDYIKPLLLDLSDHLIPGEHTMRFSIENIRAKDDDDHFGYWRVSAQLQGATDRK